MEIFIGADHRGYELKNTLKDWLQAEGHTVTDVGADKLQDGDDYPDYAFKTAQAVAKTGDSGRGLLICGSGVGMAVAANKVKGIRAALIHDLNIAKSAQNDDKVNVLALGADYISVDQAKKVITTWLSTPFSGQERHERRINKIQDFENSINP